MKALPVTCEYCGATKEPHSYWSPMSAEEFWYYEHTGPFACIKYLRSLIDDIGSRRVV
jgi:hypothetical protein